MANGGHVIKMAVYKIKRNRLRVVLPAVKEFVESVNRKEKGRTLMYSAFQKRGTPHELVHFMIFKNRKAEKQHSKSEHARKFVDVIYPNSSSEPVFIDLTRLEK